MKTSPIYFDLDKTPKPNYVMETRLVGCERVRRTKKA